MIKLIVLSAFRNLWRNKVNTLINLISLSIGLTVFAFAFIYVKKELSWNKNWQDADQIHRLILEMNGMPGQTDGTYTSINGSRIDNLKTHFSEELVGVTRINLGSARVNEIDDTRNERLHFVDPDFEKVFLLDVTSGDLKKTLNEPGYIAIEERVAEKLGENGVIGSSLTLLTRTDSELVMQIGAIFRAPESTSYSISFNMLVPANDYSLMLLEDARADMPRPWDFYVQVWARLSPEVSTENFNEAQGYYIDNVQPISGGLIEAGSKPSDHMNYTWQPVTDMYLHPVPSDPGSGNVTGNISRITTIAAVGLLVLLVGCSNAISLHLAGVLKRSKETSIRKSTGAQPADIVREYLFESFLTAIAAFIIVALLLTLLKPLLFQLSPQTFSAYNLEAGIPEYVLVTFIVLGVGLINGAYPAFVLSRIRPQSMLRAAGAGKDKHGLALRGLLVKGQFFLASALLIITSALYVQLAVTRSQPMGFSMENILQLQVGGMVDGNTPFINALRQEPGIELVLPSFYDPNFEADTKRESIHLVRKEENGITEIRAENVPTRNNDVFFRMFDIPLLAGRYFDPDIDNIQPEAIGTTTQNNEQRSLLNRSAAEALGFNSPEDAINQVIYRKQAARFSDRTALLEIPLRIIGVVEDNMFLSFSRIPGPQFYRPDNFYQFVFVKYDPAIRTHLLDRVTSIAEETPNTFIQYEIFMEDSLENAFLQEQQESRLLLICGGMALLLSCIGLYGLAAFSMERNTKEVGVRKVLGAAVPNIMGLYLWRFAKPVLIASLLACPVAVYFVLQWIEQFPYQLEKAWLLPLCLGASGTVLLIALMTVSLITARAATRKPVESLRYE